METAQVNPTSLTIAGIIITMAALLLMPGSNAFSADQQVITDDGREVLLKADGSWEFRSTDRFANTPNGHRVRLKADGSWQYMGNAPLLAENQVQTTELDIKLRNVVIEKYEKQIQKNKRVKSQTVFYLSVVLSPRAKTNVSLGKNDVNLIKVQDNKGRDYPVLSIQPSTTTLKPGTETTITIRADGSPQWWKNVNKMALVLKPGIFGIQYPIKLSQSVEDFAKKNVFGFEENE